jgi:hypothetical protein
MVGVESTDVPHTRTRDGSDLNPGGTGQKASWWTTAFSNIGLLGRKTVEHVGSSPQEDESKPVPESPKSPVVGSTKNDDALVDQSHPSASLDKPTTERGNRASLAAPPQTLERRVSVNEQAHDVLAIHQELQSLREQVKVLQTKLKEPATTHAANSHASYTENQPYHNNGDESGSDVRSPGTLAQKPRVSKRNRRAIAVAAKGYRNSIHEFVKTANYLDALRSPAVATIASRVRARLQVIAEDAMSRQHKATLKVLKGYKQHETLYSMSYHGPMVADSGEVVPEVRKVLSRQGQTNLAKAVTPTDLQSGQEGSPKDIFQHEVDNREILARTAELKETEPLATARKDDGLRLLRQIHTQPQSTSPMKNPRTEHAKPERTNKPARKANETLTPSTKEPLQTETATTSSGNVADSGQSIMEELFPEVTQAPKPPNVEERDQYPKLDLPDSMPLVRREFVERPLSLQEQAAASFKRRGEQITVLQLLDCSTQLTEVDFSRLIPRGRHIEAWRRGGEFFKIIPGRDPLSMERLPFYYILFKDPESALAYQKNVSRIHKLNALHQPSSIFSAIPPPKGFLEDGEDVSKLVSSYNLLPTHHKLGLITVMQPYNPALRAVIERGGYQPIVPDTDEHGNRIWKVLMHIEGWEPTPSELFGIFKKDAYRLGMLLTLRNESRNSIHRLRDMLNLKTTLKPISTSSPRAYGSFDHTSDNAATQTEYEDEGIKALMAGMEEDSSSKEIHQYIMRRLYNRWILDFEDEDAARRFAISWHRRVLPDGAGSGGWQDAEEARVCNTEVLW